LENILQVANSVPFWIMAFFFVSLIIFQAIIFIYIAKKAAPNVGMTSVEVKTALRTGFVSSIGPSFATTIIILSMISVLGSPITIMRIGIIGGGSTELGAAAIGADVFGTTLGAADFSMQALAAVVWTMFIGGMGWLLFVALFTKRLEKTQNKIKKRNPKMMATITLGALLGAFGYLSSQQMSASLNHTIAGVIAIASMFFIMIIADKHEIQWLKEWALGISMAVGMTIGYLTTFI